MHRISRIAVAAAGLVLAGGATAAAVSAPPEAADKGLSTAEEHSGVDVPAANTDHPTPEDHPGAGADEVEANEGVGPVDNHGAEVSAAAQDRSTIGREHGEAVSAVARGDHGPATPAEAGAPVASPNDGGTDTADDASGGASEVGKDAAAAQASLGSDNAGEHGRP